MTKREPNADELAGMAWWNAMTEQQRSEAMRVAKAETVAEAWKFEKAITDVRNQLEGRS